MEEDYLRYRIRSTEYLGEKLIAADVPIIRPPGGHAIYLDARALLPHVPPLAYPGIALANQLYVEAGIRGVEIGTVMFGMRPDGTERPGPMDLVRLAIPRRVYTQSHIDYVAEAVDRGGVGAGQPARLPHRLGAEDAAAFHGHVRADGLVLRCTNTGTYLCPQD